MGEKEIHMQMQCRGEDIVLPMEWVVELESQLPKTADKEAEAHVWKKHTIYKIPHSFATAHSDDAYKPQKVSFGPYHHGEPRLQPMEEHKRRALLHYLRRTNTTLPHYMAQLSPLLQQLMDCYKDLDKEWYEEPGKFLQLMMLDGCFMLEMLRTSSTGGGGGNIIQDDYAQDDPIFGRHRLRYNRPRIKRDMLMVENQIPLLVLKQLLFVEQGLQHRDEQSLIRLVNNLVINFFKLPPPKPADSGSMNCITGQLLCCFNLASPIPKKAPKSTTAASKYSEENETRKEELGLHVLDVVRKSMIKGMAYEPKEPPEASTDVIWPATQLQEAGIKFMKSRSRSLVDVDFDISYGFLFKRGILRLPEIIVDDATKSKLLNLMAFEHLHACAGNEVSSYVCFMDNIIDSENDVSLLSQSNIIKNFVGTDQAVADLFNGLSHDVAIDRESKLFAVQNMVIKYCNGCCNRSCANLKHTHFRNPWSGIALLAASVVLCITIIQFVYSLLSYYLHDG